MHNNNRFDGLFVSLEGIDGAGTTTLSSLLQEELRSNWEFTQEPSNGKYGQIIREELSNDSDPTLSDMFLFLADRSDHIQSLIGPKLDQGTNVVCDRYNLSTFAYQIPVVEETTNLRSGYGYIGECVDPFIIVPDLTIWIDIPVDVSLERSDTADKYEKDPSRLGEARAIYRDAYNRLDRVKRIDGEQSEIEVLNEVMRYIENAKD